MHRVTVPRIETFFIAGPVGRLECFLKRPAAAAAGRIEAGTTVAVVCHPHPLFGGTMHNKVVHAAAEALAGLGMSVMRFNFRGAGRSAGAHDGGGGETDDLKAVLEDVAARFPGAPILAVGYSFGAWVALRVGCADPRVAALIGIAAPVGVYDFRFLRGCGVPLALIQGEADPLAPLPLVLALAATLPGGGGVLPIAGATHGFANHLDALADQVVRAIPAHLRPASA
jgi:alpha/beta superfamily hydrolase